MNVIVRVFILITSSIESVSRSEKVLESRRAGELESRRVFRPFVCRRRAPVLLYCVLALL